MKINLTKLLELATEPSDDLQLFGTQFYIDPETGDKIEAEGYDCKKNQELIVYASNVDKAFMNLYKCTSDVFFFEELISPENLPTFDEQEKFAQYLKLNYQHWLIKLNSCYDCILQVLNAAFELAVPLEKVNYKTVVTKSKIIFNNEIQEHLEGFKELLCMSLKEKRNNLIHRGSFNHIDIDTLHTHGFITRLQLLDWDNADFQNYLGQKSIELIEEVNKINIEMITEVYPLLEYTNLEYKRRFKEKLVI